MISLADHGGGGKHPRIRRCVCQETVDLDRRRRYLEDIDGLSARERSLAFGGLRRADNNRAIESVEQAVGRRKGLITLTGKPGTGKTTLLICAVNAARERGIPAVYVVMADLLDYLRAAYNPTVTTTLTFDARWELLTHAEVLAIDEMDQFNATQWATERFLLLIDERWRNMDTRLTLLATNSRLVELPDKVYSRLRDGRAYTYSMAGPDVRPALRDDR